MLSLSAACFGSYERERSNESIDASFRQSPEVFARLRDAILAEPACDAVWMDHYEWTDPCNTGSCAKAPPPPKTGRPPGVAAKSCDYESHCTHWVDRPPTAEILASICHMPVARAREYMKDMRRIGALRLYRGRLEGDAAATFSMSFAGMVGGGTTTEVVWRSSPPPTGPLAGAPFKGAEEHVPLASGWWRRKTWD